jgi:two-component system CheB/CheR fusion protein
LAALLRLWGFDPEVAGDGPAALEMAAQNPPDAVLIDIGLPGMDGFELAEQLSTKPELKGCVLAAVTAYSDPETIAHSRRAGMMQHFTKPADLVRLHRLLDDRRYALAKQLDEKTAEQFHLPRGGDHS